jgi:hypothetical protein
MRIHTGPEIKDLSRDPALGDLLPVFKRVGKKIQRARSGIAVLVITVDLHEILPRAIERERNGIPVSLKRDTVPGRQDLHRIHVVLRFDDDIGGSLKTEIDVFRIIHVAVDADCRLRAINESRDPVDRNAMETAGHVLLQRIRTGVKDRYVFAVVCYTSRIRIPGRIRRFLRDRLRIRRAGISRIPPTAGRKEKEKRRGGA